ncbi:hypothetical protein [Methylobacter sp.]|uniref:hypothetical protein n=1 Tax=Methylobacter sp. TaxID=2051955 RepID=UPI002FDE6478
MKVGFLEAAEYELQCAMHYYNQQKQGLGHEFLAEIKAAVARITDFCTGSQAPAWEPSPGSSSFPSTITTQMVQPCLEAAIASNATLVRTS